MKDKRFKKITRTFSSVKRAVIMRESKRCN